MKAWQKEIPAVTNIQTEWVTSAKLCWANQKGICLEVPLHVDVCRFCCSVYCIDFRAVVILWSYCHLCRFQMRIWPNLPSPEQKELIFNEESIVYSQAIHYANRMVYMRVPLDATKTLHESANPGMEGESTSSNITNRYDTQKMVSQ